MNLLEPDVLTTCWVHVVSDGTVRTYFDKHDVDAATVSTIIRALFNAGASLAREHGIGVDLTVKVP